MPGAQTNNSQGTQVESSQENREVQVSPHPGREQGTDMKDMVVKTLRFAKLSAKAMAPTKGSQNAAGYDLYSARRLTIPPRGKELVATDLAVRVPDGTYGRIAPRSGLAAKYFIDVGAGVVDIDYTGNVGVLLFNHGEEPFEVKEGDRIAQLICEKIVNAELEEVKELKDTERGDGGFGSTGKN